MLSLREIAWNKTNASSQALALYNMMNGNMAFHELSRFTDDHSLYEKGDF